MPDTERNQDTQDDVKVRCGKAISHLKGKADGSHVVVQCRPYDVERISAVLREFASWRHIGVELTADERGIRVTRSDKLFSPGGKYAAIASLRPGESTRFDVPPEQHYRVRIAASNRSARQGLRFACARDGDAIVVTRLDGVGPAAASSRARRVRKIDLSPLASVNGIRFETDNHDHIRAICTSAARANGWVLYAKGGPGAITVYRLDNLNVVFDEPPAQVQEADKPAGPAVAPAPVEAMEEASHPDDLDLNDLDGSDDDWRPDDEPAPASKETPSGV